MRLDLKGLSVSTGAACSSGPSSRRLDRDKVASQTARASLRFSLGKQNSTDDVEFALQLIPEVEAVGET